MSHTPLLKLVSTFLGMGLIALAQAEEVMTWNRIPLALPLATGQERIVFMNRDMRVGVPAALADHLRVQSMGGALYLKADKPIAPTRLELQDVTSGEMVLLDIEAHEPKQGEKLEPVRIQFQAATPPTPSPDAPMAEPESQTLTAEDMNAITAAEVDQPTTPTPVMLTRYAAQQLYAPVRTIEAVSGIGSRPVEKSLELSALMPAQPIKATALAAWGMADYQVTAVRLQNQSANRVGLDARELNGALIAATFQHRMLEAKGSAADTTVAYLVTRQQDLRAALLNPHQVRENTP